MNTASEKIYELDNTEWRRVKIIAFNSLAIFSLIIFGFVFFVIFYEIKEDSAFLLGAMVITLTFVNEFLARNLACKACGEKYLRTIKKSRCDADYTDAIFSIPLDIIKNKNFKCPCCDAEYTGKR